MCNTVMSLSSKELLNIEKREEDFVLCFSKFVYPFTHGFLFYSLGFNPLIILMLKLLLIWPLEALQLGFYAPLTHTPHLLSISYFFEHKDIPGSSFFFF